MKDPKNIDQAVASIASWAFIDTSANLVQSELRAALARDMGAGAPLPTEKDCEALICADHGSENQKRVSKLYPATDAWLIQCLA